MFYLKLLIPAILFSLLMDLRFGFTASGFGLCFLVLLPSFHFLIYELRVKDEYYFYANFGFSRAFLWVTTIALSIFINILTKFL
ncbi:hypothetical protein [Chryseobacterium sp. POE27]|uniref:hypothetical protein n=1 Tax=Chryseobacterium sp. POE27 TaxID=3138177 RepID=UPI00321B1F88